ncbi:MAG: Ig-like domain-containing protein [Planctomycetota bacterium]
MNFSQGIHTIRLTAEDLFGNAAEPVEFDFTIDDVAPAPPTTLVLVDETGTPLSQNVIAGPRFQVQIQADDESIVRLLRDGIPIGVGVIDSDTPTGTADFIVDIGGLSDGDFTLQAVTEDLAGNQSEATAPLTLTLDSTAPRLFEIDLDPDDDTDASGDRTTSLPQVDLIGESEAGAIISIESLNIQTVAAADGSFRLADVPLEFGSNTFLIVTEDALGNRSETSLALIRPKLESVSPLLTLAAGEDTGLYFNDNVSQSIAISGAMDDASPIDRLEATVTVTSAASGVITAYPVVDFVSSISGSTYAISHAELIAALESASGQTVPDGLVEIDLVATDIYENASGRQSIAIQLDRTAPLPPADFRLAATSDLGRHDDDAITSLTDLSWDVRLTAEATVDIWVDGVKSNSFRLPEGVHEITLDNIAAGSHQVHVTATDVAGNVSDASDPFTVVVDLEPPSSINGDVELPIVGSDSGAIFGSTDAGSTVSLVRGLDSVNPIASTLADASGAYRFDAVRFADGRNEFRVIAEDLAGNALETDVTFRYDAPDLSPPEITLGLANDTGMSTDDLLTRLPDVIGTIDDASRIASLRISVNDSPFVASLGSLRDGRLELSAAVLATILESELPDGDVRVRVVATDEVGHVSDIEELNFTLDTQRPPTPADLVVNADDDSGTPGDGITNVASIRLHTRATADDARVQLFAEGMVVYSAPAAGDITLHADLSETSTRYVAQAIDMAGNVSFFTAPKFLRLDQQFVAPLIELPVGSRRIDLGSAFHTTEPVVSLVGRTEPGTILEVRDQVGFATADPFGRFEIENVSLRAGVNNLIVDLTDPGGNQASVPVELTFVDTQGPEFDLGLAVDTGRSDSDKRTQDPSITGTLRDAGPITQLLGSLSGSPAVDVTDALNEDLLQLDLARLETIFGDVLPDGRHRLDLFAIDGAGNESSTSFTFDLDRTAPPNATAVDLLTADDLGFDARDSLTAVTSPTLRLYAERGATVRFYVDGSEVGEVLSTGVAAFTLPDLESGVYDVTASIEDAAGNVADPTPALELSIDSVAPIDSELVMQESFRSTVRDNHTTAETVNLIATVEPGSRLLLSGNAQSAYVGPTGTLTFFGVPLNVGRNELVLVTEDAAGNQIEQTFVFTRGALLPPEFTLQVQDIDANRPPQVSGRLRAENAITMAEVSFDPDFQRGVVDLLPRLSANRFEFSPAEVEALYGGPITAGDATLHFRAADSMGRESEVTTLAWNREPSQVPMANVNVAEVAGGFRYAYELTGTSDVTLATQAIALPVVDETSLADVLLPSGWEVVDDGDSSVWTLAATNPDAALRAGESIVFAWTSAQPPTRRAVSAQLQAIDGGDPISVDQSLQVPADPGDVAIDDAYSAVASEDLTIPAITGVRANDRDPSATMWLSDSRSAWGAVVSVDDDGSFTWTPGDAFAGLGVGETVVDVFHYTLRVAGGATHTATVEIEVSGENSMPIAADDVPSEDTTSLWTCAGVPVEISPADLLANDFDPDVNDALMVSTIAATTLLGGTVNFDGDAWIYDPSGVADFGALAAGMFLDDSFSYTIVDPSGESSTAVAQLRVYSSLNVPPTATDQSATLNELGELQGTGFEGLLVGASDADALPGDSTLVAVDETVTANSGASVRIHPDGTFEYDSSGIAAIEGLQAGETATDSFAFRVFDGTDASSVAQVALTIVGVNNAPAAVDDEYNGLLADDLLAVDANSGLLANDSDVDSPGPLIIDPSRTPETTAAGAVVTLRPDGSFDYIPGDVFVYLADGQIGYDEFEYTVLDDRGAETVAKASIEIIGVDDAPVTGDDDVTEGFWTIAGQAIEVPAERGVLVNDYDPDSGASGSTLIAEFDGFSQYGARVIVNADGSFSYDPTQSVALAQLQAAGTDVIDTFTYTVREGNSSRPVGGGKDDGGRDDGGKDNGGPTKNNQASSEGVVEIVVSSGASGYKFTEVASGYQSIGKGVSINNHGTVAFQANVGGSDGLFIAEKDSAPISLIPESFAFGGGGVSQPPDNGPGSPPSASFSEVVQINDSNKIFAQRSMSAEVMIGTVMLGLPLMTFSNVILTYGESWNGQTVLDGGSYGAPEQLAGGDMGLGNAGLRWGHPLMTDLIFLTTLGVIPGAVGAALTAPFTMVPRIWTINPVWASTYYTPANPLWNVFQDPDNFDFDTFNSVSLATSLVPIFFPKIYVPPFNVIYPTTASMNNAGNALFVGETNSSAGSGGLQIVRTTENKHAFFAGGGISDPVQNGMIADTRYSVFVDEGALKAIDPSGGISDLPLDPIGDSAAISDSGVVAVAADGPLGQGIYVVDPRTSNYAKVAGISGDGTVDPNEQEINGEDVGPISAFTNKLIGINGPVADAPSNDYFTVVFTAIDSEGSEGVHTARFYMGQLENEPLAPGQFLGHSEVFEFGDMLPGVGPISDVGGFDVVNSSGQLAFWADGDRVITAEAPVFVRGEVVAAFEQIPMGDDEVLGRSGGNRIGTFSAGRPDAGPSDFTVTVDYGDGSVGEAQVLATDSPTRFEIVSDHTYPREGTYAITIQVSDNGSQTGGIGVGLANVINVINGEDIERLSFDNSHRATSSRSFPLIEDDRDPCGGGDGEGGSDDSLGLTTAVSLTGGDFQAAAQGTGVYTYKLALDTSENTGRVEPDEVASESGGLMNIRRVISTGSLDPVSFSPASFSVTSYVTGYDSSFQSCSPSVSQRQTATEESTTTSTASGIVLDEKSYNSGSMDWLRIEETTSRFTTDGERFADADTLGQLGALMGGNDTSLVGAFTSSGTSIHTETLRETGSARGTVQRDYKIETESSSRQTGGRGTFEYTVTSTSSNVMHSRGEATPGGFDLEIRNQSNSQSRQVSTNLTQRTVTDSSSESVTVVHKEGEIEVLPDSQSGGDFTLESVGDTTSQSSSETTNGSRTTTADTTSTSRETITGGGSAIGGDYRFTVDRSVTSTTQQTESNQTLQSNSTVVRGVETNSIESGAFYTGDYSHEQFIVETVSDTGSQTNTVDGEDALVSTHQNFRTTTTRQTITGNRSSGEVVVNDRTNVNAEDQVTSVQGGVTTQSTTLTDTLGNGEKNISRDGDQYVFETESYDSTMRETTSTRTQGTHVVVVTSLSVVEVDGSAIGNFSDGVSTVDQTTRTTTESTTIDTNQTRSMTTRRRVVGEQTSKRTPNSISGHCAHEVDGVEQITIDTLTLNQDQSVTEHREIDRSTTSQTTGNRIIGRSTADSRQIDAVRSREIESLGKTAKITDLLGSEILVIAVTANSLSGIFREQREQESSNTIVNRSLAGPRELESLQRIEDGEDTTLLFDRVEESTTIADTTSSQISTGNQITGDYRREKTEDATIGANTTHRHRTLTKLSERDDTIDRTRVETGNNLSGTYRFETNETTTSLETATLANGTLFKTEQVSTQSGLTTIDTGNQFDGSYSVESTLDLDSQTDSQSDNQGRRLVQSVTVDSTVSRNRSGDKVTGLFTETSTSESTDTTSQVATIRTETVTDEDVTTRISTGTHSGNSVTGISTRIDTADIDRTGSSVTTNQTLRRELTFDDERTETTENTFHTFTGVQSIERDVDSELTETRTVTNQTKTETSTGTILSQTSDLRTGSTATGLFTTTKSSTQEKSTTETTENGPMTQQREVDVRIESDGTSSEDVFTGTRSLVQTVTTSTETTAEQTNQDETQSETSSRTDARTINRTGNDVIGTYQTDVTISSSATQNSETTSGPSTITRVASSSSLTTQSTIGDDIRGDFEMTSFDVTNVSDRTTSVNQTRTVITQSVRRDEASQSSTGNQITGMESGSIDTTSVSTIEKTQSNGPLRVSADIVDELTSQRIYSRDNVTASASETKTEEGTHQRTETITNGSLAASVTETSEMAASTTRTNEAILGTYATLGESTQSSTVIGSDTNKTLSVNYTNELESTTTQTDSGNAIVGDFDSATETTETSERFSTRVNGDLTSVVDVMSTQTTNVATTGNSVAGTSTATTTVASTTDLTQSDTNQSLAVSVVQRSTTDSSATDTVNQFTGAISGNATMDVTTARTETSTNGPYESTIVVDTDDEMSRSYTGNSFVGTRRTIGNQTVNVDTTSTEIVSGQTSTRTDTTTSTVATDNNENQITGAYTTTTDTAANSTSTGRLENQTLLVTDSITSDSESQSTEIGNSISGAFTLESTGEASSSETSQTTNQVQVTDATLDTTSETETTHSGNRISGLYTIESTSTDTETSTENNDIVPVTAIAASATIVRMLNETGDEVTGAATSTSVVDRDSTSTETFEYLDLDASQTIVTDATVTTETTSNAFSGQSDQTITSDSTLVTTRSENNQDLVFVEIESTETIASSATESFNTITGAGTTTSTTTVDTDSIEESTNQSQSIRTESESSETTETTGTSNQVSGVFEIDSTSTGSSQVVTTETNQTSTIARTIDATSESESSTTGNEITGASTYEQSSETTATTNQTETNQTQTVTSTTTATSESSGSGSDQSITGTYASENETTETATATIVTTNQTYRDETTRVSETTTTVTSSGNSLTKAFESITTVDAVTEVDSTSTNQTLTVVTDSTESQDTTITETGNARFGTYTTVTNQTLGNVGTQTRTNQTESTTGSFDITTVSEITRSGNRVSGEVTVDSDVETTSSDSATTTNQTLSTSTTSSSALDEVFRQVGNEISGDYTTSGTQSATSDSTTNETNTDRSIESESESTSSATITGSGNWVAGTSSTTTTSESDSTLEQNGTIGDRSFTASETSEADSTDTTVSNQFTGASTTTTEATVDSDRSKTTTYTDGTDTKTETSSVTSNSTRVSNAITGIYTDDATTTETADIEEDGTRKDTYASSVNRSTTIEADSEGNSVTGPYDDSTETTTNSTTRRDWTDGDGNTFAIDETASSTNQADEVGNRITGTQSSSRTAESDTQRTQIATPAAGGTHTSIEIVDAITVSTGTANTIVGTSTVDDELTIVTTLRQDGTVAGSTVDYDSTSTLTGDSEVTANSITGVSNSTSTTSDDYSFTQVISRTDGTGYTLTGSGTVDQTSTASQNTLTGDASSEATGTDTYTLTQTGDDASGVYEVNLSGEDSFTKTSTSNSRTGVFDRSTELDGSVTGTRTVGGVDTAINEVVDQVIQQEGNYVDGDIDISFAGQNRYDALVEFEDTSDAATESSGTLDHSPIGAPLMLGSPPSVPTDGMMEAVIAAAVGPASGAVAEVTTSMAVAGLRGSQAMMAGSAIAGTQWSGSATIESYAMLGNDAADQYCFPAGTEVLLSSGQTKRIEDIQVGDEVATSSLPTTSSLPSPLRNEGERGWGRGATDTATTRRGATHPATTGRGATHPATTGRGASATATTTDTASCTAHPVTATYQTADQTLIDVHVGPSILSVTPGHLVFEATQGWTHAGDLLPGDELINHDQQRLVVTAVTPSDQPSQTVYNFAVSEVHHYHVRLPGSDHFVLVHNESFGKYTYGNVLADVAAAEFNDIINTPISELLQRAVSDAVGAIMEDANALLIGAGNALSSMGMQSIGQWMVNSGNEGLENDTLFGYTQQEITDGVIFVAKVGVTVAIVGVATLINPVAGVGAALGIADAILDAKASGRDVTMFDIIIGGAIGAMNPLGAATSLGGGLIGAGIESAIKGEWTLGVGYRVGSLVGGLVGMGVDDIAKGAKLAHAGRQALFLGNVQALAGVTTYIATGDANFALDVANIAAIPGMMGARKFIKCFPGETLVHRPLESATGTSTDSIDGLFASGDFLSSPFDRIDAGETFGRGGTTATLPATRTVPIAEIKVGQRVIADHPHEDETHPDWAEPDWSDTGSLTVRFCDEDDREIRMTTLRSKSELLPLRNHIGQHIDFYIPTTEQFERVQIERIDWDVDIEPGEGRVVLSTFEHEADELVELTIPGESKPIRCTKGHLIYDATTDRWTPAEDLDGDTTFDTPDAPRPLHASCLTTVTRTQVYNLEVHGPHTYRVGDQGILVHNQCEHTAQYMAKQAAYQKYVARQQAKGAQPLGIQKWAKESGYTEGIAKHAQNLKSADNERQLHHLISNPMVRALEKVGFANARTLRDSKAMQYLSSPGAHVGYEKWHRAADSHFVEFIKRKGSSLTESDLIKEINRYYKSGDIASRIPGVNVQL